jgi:hypothetical protein
MGIGADLGGSLGDILGLGVNDGSDDAKNFYQQLVAKYGALDPRVQAAKEATEQQGASGLPAAGAGSQGAQMDALRELQTQYRSGGLDAISKAQLAQSNAGANRAAAANAGMIQQRARAQGAGRSGTSLMLQQMAGQQAMEQGNQQAMGAAAQAQQNRMGALAGASQLSTGMRGQDYQAADAQDAVNQFNTAIRQGANTRNADRSQSAQQATFSNGMQQLGGEGAAYGGVYGAKQAAAERQRRAFSGIGRLAGAGADAYFGGGGGGGGGGWSMSGNTPIQPNGQPGWMGG